MSVKKMIQLCVAAAICAGLLVAAPSMRAAKKPNLLTANKDAVEVSIIALIASPEKYEGKLVRVIGFVHLRFEANAVYFHDEDFQRAIAKNALWLDIPNGTPDPVFSTGQYAIVEGVFTARKQGHMNDYSGELSNVTRLQPWRINRP